MSEYHIPVLLNESIDGLNIKKGGVYVDVTFGGGGHSAEILRRLEGGRLFAFDQDEDALENKIQDSRLQLIHHNFRYLSNFIRYHNEEKIDGLLADLGVSSHEFDEGERGFSFRFDADLDMRMNRNIKFKASDILNEYSDEDLYYIFRNYGEIKNTGKLVKLIVSHREENRIETTQDFREVIDSCIPKNKENRYLAQVYQALRIEVNSELDALKEMLEQAADLLKKGGRLSVITYHSLEDRLVKNFFKSGNFEGKVEKDFYGNVQTCFKLINKKVITPSEEELKLNNRARSAKLRIVEKI
ncbi:MAG: 16S rRNA (cytosine(1402)-N(4))-methyltransferase RsmH [Marinifilaceae bacterium]|jgi:16S rRNA (cytosine1402-N4)-methyltransferase|nr:16S rRNA (cytosine(1402)-N(4))-methyltransferase RsmH [Marinilabiliaceae bacterium JC040]MCT4600751.1 16S rRNA (cytosine(1402)-N(4))-methyltransferase RsmH [Marinifilaceae bacterium]